ncbi:MAG: WYL domain-containing protein [Myxococcota bacterium]|nr:WYL domain-containing protein [Myxococcota bacterium]
MAHRPVVRAAVRGEASGDARLEDRFAYIPWTARGYAHRSDDIDAAFQAVADFRVLRFRYREETIDGKMSKDGKDGKDGKSSRVTSHPYALVLHGGSIICLARDIERSSTRAFLFDRMNELDATSEEKFEMPPEFSIADWLQGDFGVAKAAHSFKLLIEFDPRVAEVVRARRVHPSQKLAVAADGRVRASLVLPEAPEVLAQVRSWVLGFGAAARLLEPQELAEDLARELRRAAERYTT